MATMQPPRINGLHAAHNYPPHRLARAMHTIQHFSDKYSKPPTTFTGGPPFNLNAIVPLYTAHCFLFIFIFLETGNG